MIEKRIFNPPTLLPYLQNELTLRMAFSYRIYYPSRSLFYYLHHNQWQWVDIFVRNVYKDIIKDREILVLTQSINLNGLVKRIHNRLKHK